MFGEMIKGLFNSNKKKVLLAVMLVLGVSMILFSSVPFSSSDNLSDADESLADYKERLESELGELCSSVKGVGKCQVTVAFERGAMNTYKGSMLIESKPPKVMGVTVVCAGADSDAVRAEIIDIMTALFDIGSNRVAVLKLNF